MKIENTIVHKSFSDLCMWMCQNTDNELWIPADKFTAHEIWDILRDISIETRKPLEWVGKLSFMSWFNQLYKNHSWICVWLDFEVNTYNHTNDVDISKPDEEIALLINQPFIFKFNHAAINVDQLHDLLVAE